MGSHTPSFSQLVARIATRFINAPITTLDVRFGEALAQVARFAQVDNGRVLRFEDDSTRVTTYIDWPPDTTPTSRTAFDMAHYAWWLARLRAGESVVYDAQTPMPDDAVDEQAAFDRLGWSAAMSAPVMCDGVLWGLIELKVSRPGYRWRPAVIAGLRLVCEVFGSALQRRSRELAYQNQVRFLDALTRSLPVTAFIYDRRVQQTIWLNRTMLPALGFDQAFINQHDFDTLNRSLMHPEDLAQFATMDAKLDDLPDGVPIEWEYRMRDAQDEWRWLLAYACVFQRDDEGHVIKVIGSVQDISERKAHQRRQRQLDAQVQHAQRLESLEVLAGGVAHDFNNLLVGILGNAELISLRDDLPADMQERMRAILAAARQASSVTEQLLRYAGRTESAPRPVPLDHELSQSLPLLRAAVPPHIAFTMSLNADHAQVLGDPGQLRQVVINLVTNAIEAVGDSHGSIVVRTSVCKCGADKIETLLFHEGLEPGTFVELEVRDTGVGMDPALCPRIFEPFFSTKSSGRGLGLAAVAGTVRRHTGGLGIHSLPNEGTCFHILLPVHNTMTQKDPSKGPGQTGQWRGEGRVLVVDDEEYVRDVLTLQLKHLGFEVVSAPDGRDALAQLSTLGPTYFAAVILDRAMPGLNGDDTFVSLRKHAPTLPVVMVSGHHGDKNADPNAHYLRKPFSMAKLRQALQQLLS